MPPGSGFATRRGLLFLDETAERAIVFIDGNNLYYSMKDVGVEGLSSLNYAMMSLKLAGPRKWVGTRYYIGRVPQSGDTTLYAAQRRFLARLTATDPRISAHLGRLESQPRANEMAKELRVFLSGLSTRMDPAVFRELMALAKRHEYTNVFVEKAVDVMLAVDMVTMATNDVFDAAHLLPADGDFTPAVDAVREVGKKVYAVSPLHGAQLAASVNSFIHLTREWLEDCHDPPLLN
jgi:hypothetical protein